MSYFGSCIGEILFEETCDFEKGALLLKYIKYLFILILRMIFFLPHC